MIQLFLASSAFQALGCAAMINSGSTGPDGSRRVLVVANNVTTPEVARPFNLAPGAAGYLDAFDQVVDLNQAIAPIHPRHFAIDPTQAGLLERYLRLAWDLGSEPVELILESLPNAPGGSLARIFRDAEVSMHSDGLMSYGPLRNKVPGAIAQRVKAVYYTDLIPGLLPTRLGGQAPQLVPSEREPVKALFDRCGQLAAETDLSPWPAGTALLLGQYLTDLGAITREEESALHIAMIDTAVQAGMRRVVFKPHPAASRTALQPLADHAASRRIEFEVLAAPVSAEALMGWRRPELVVSCFSTALATARYVYDLPVRAVGTDLVLERIVPYENSNRVPMVLCDALFGAEPLRAPALDGPGTPAWQRVQDLVRAVTYLMQPVNERHLRPVAEAYLRAALGHPPLHYFSRTRLGDHGLPGGEQQLHRSAGSLGRRAVRKIRRVLKG